MRLQQKGKEMSASQLAKMRREELKKRKQQPNVPKPAVIPELTTIIEP